MIYMSQGYARLSQYSSISGGGEGEGYGSVGGGSYYGFGKGCSAGAEAWNRSSIFSNTETGRGFGCGYGYPSGGHGDGIGDGGGDGAGDGYLRPASTPCHWVLA